MPQKTEPIYENMIDYIYATSTETITGNVTEIVTYYHVPFFDFLVVFFVFLFGLLVLKFFYKVIYIPRQNDVNLKVNLAAKSNKYKSSFFE